MVIKLKSNMVGLRNAQTCGFLRFRGHNRVIDHNMTIIIDLTHVHAALHLAYDLKISPKNCEIGSTACDGARTDAHGASSSASLADRLPPGRPGQRPWPPPSGLWPLQSLTRLPTAPISLHASRIHTGRVHTARKACAWPPDKLRTPRRRARRTHSILSRQPAPSGAAVTIS